MVRHLLNIHIHHKGTPFQGSPSLLIVKVVYSEEVYSFAVKAFLFKGWSDIIFPIINDFLSKSVNFLYNPFISEVIPFWRILNNIFKNLVVKPYTIKCHSIIIILSCIIAYELIHIIPIRT